MCTIKITTCIYAAGYIDVRNATEQAIAEGTQFCSIWCLARLWK